MDIADQEVIMVIMAVDVESAALGMATVEMMHRKHRVSVRKDHWR